MYFDIHIFLSVLLNILINFNTLVNLKTWYYAIFSGKTTQMWKYYELKEFKKFPKKEKTSGIKETVAKIRRVGISLAEWKLKV